ncbi:MAG: hypothetical protein PHC34_07125 [Candidatus Gastranaerophilales bacterium]|nr:hypothetical protein [Candidatus Gastranaerophilales bacterium]
MKNSFNKPEAYEKYYQYLIRDFKFFETMKDIFMLSAVIGFKNNTSLPFPKSGGEPIKDHIFSEEDKNIMDIIAIETRKDLKILLKENQEEKYKMMEEYAHAGIQYIVKNIFIAEEVTDADKLLDFVCKYAPNSEIPKQPDISTMMSNIVEELEL